MSPTKILFVCSRNRLRSLTAEKVFAEFPDFEARSVGTQPDARILVTEGHLGWADVIFVMEKEHLAKLRDKFPDALEGKKIFTLHIPDDYQFMQPELVDELLAKVSEHLDLDLDLD
ncbi:MAG: protein tyrosine phosphatase [Verrucomicrobiae bacterium]|nr:protein tyrosine phosphatase [Verrucomicrobiae bacterium]